MKDRLILFFTLTAVIIAVSCTSRYRLDMFLEEEGEEYRVSVESSEYYLDAALGSPFETPRLVAGGGTVALLHLSIAGRPFLPKEDKFVMDNQLRARLYLELAPGLPREPFALPERCYVQVIGRYEWPPEETFFPASDGTAVIDSVASGRLFMTLTDARFVNSIGRDISLYGQFKFKINQ